MKEYNGFTPAERTAAWKIQKKAIQDGTLIQEPCEMCTQDEGLLMPHLEDYDQPLIAYHWLCVECHMTLHSRFSNPTKWVKLLLKLREGYKAPKYENVLTFFNKSGWDNSPTPDFKPDENKWWERLSLDRVVFRELSEEKKSYIR
jgi:hypothetical protein